MPKFRATPGCLILLLILFAFARGDLPIFAAIVLSVVAHEVGHLVPALCFGVKVKEFGANLMGFYLRRETARNRMAEAVIIAGGLAVTLAIAIESRGVVRFFNCWCLLLANAIPAPWSDGGRLLRTLKRAA